MNSRVGRLGGHSHDSRNLTFLFRSREATTHRVYLNEVDTPLDAINTFKLRFVNGSLARCNEFLGQRYRPFSEFEVFSSDEIPSNSDVTFILSQYIACAEELRADNIYQWDGNWYWDIDGVKPEDREGRIATPPPKKLARK